MYYIYQCNPVELALRKFSFILLIFPLVVLSQTAIPKPPEITTADTLIKTGASGDYDGDLNEDVLVYWGFEGAGVGEVINYVSVYSYEKSAHLLVVKGEGHRWADKIQFVNLNGDYCVELIIRDKIYSFTNTGDKKKLH